MGRSYAPEPDTFSKLIGDDSDSDSSPQAGMYEIEETSQEMYSYWSNSSRYLSQNCDRALPAREHGTLSRHNISYVRGGTPGGDSDLDGRLSSLFQRTTTNLFQRDFEEASAALARLLRPSRRSPRNVTPSLISDDTSRTSSSSFSPNITLPRELAPAAPLSPPVQPKLVEEVATDVSEAPGVTWIDHEAAQETYSIPQVAQDAASSPVQTEEPTDIVMPPSVPSAQPKHGVSALGEIPSKIVSIPPQLPIPAPVLENNEMGTQGDDSDEYQPPNNKTSRSTKRVNRKSTSSTSGFKCTQCGVTFTRNYDMLRHIKSIHEDQSYDKLLALTCPCCFEVLSRKDAFKRHILRVPDGCKRKALLQGRVFEPKNDPQLFALCRANKPPLARIPAGPV
ncbi:hypothetical protein CVT26_011814 [Gymnopilus dilepis]|uniref:C2H2-type domain-containing protein n=1 Tax=Gymnopilus dilepis TaxID=231916 RepID=A0A409W999_9AGAR|nr:hypothetical protein CVT26_011814 [Gymnopilus dilepis]